MMGVGAPRSPLLMSVILSAAGVPGDGRLCRCWGGGAEDLLFVAPQNKKTVCPSFGAPLFGANLGWFLLYPASSRQGGRAVLPPQ
jgi:hypothetical protein